MAYKYVERKKRQIPKIPKKFLLVLLAIVAVVSTAYLLSGPTSVLEIINIYALPALSTAGYVKVDVQADIVGNMGVVTLKSGCYQIIATTEATQAESIATGLSKKKGSRPVTHDLMKDAFDNLGIEVVMVKIVDLRENAYMARLILRQGSTVLNLDSRPSDGTALAVRTGSPIYIKEDLMKSMGSLIC